MGVMQTTFGRRMRAGFTYTYSQTQNPESGSAGLPALYVSLHPFGRMLPDVLGILRVIPMQ